MPRHGMGMVTEKSYSVLTVGTEILTKDLMDHHLRSLGPIKTFYASKLDFALQTMNQEKISVIFCESSFADASALQFLERIGGLHFNAAKFFVLASRGNDKNLTALCREFAIDELLLKPFNAETIKKIMQRAMEKLEGPVAQHTSDIRAALDAEAFKRFLEAEALFSEACKKHMHREVWLEAARFWFSRSRFEDAEKVLKILLAEDSSDAAALDLMGRICARSGRLQLALHFLGKAQSVSPLNYLRNIAIAEVHVAIADEYLREAVRLEETLGVAQLELIKHHVNRRNYVLAINQAELKRSQIKGELERELNAYISLAKSQGKIK